MLWYTVQLSRNSILWHILAIISYFEMYRIIRCSLVFLVLRYKKGKLTTWDCSKLGFSKRYQKIKSMCSLWCLVQAWEDCPWCHSQWTMSVKLSAMQTCPIYVWVHFSKNIPDCTSMRGQRHTICRILCFIKWWYICEKFDWPRCVTWSILETQRCQCCWFRNGKKKQCQFIIGIEEERSFSPPNPLQNWHLAAYNYSSAWYIKQPGPRFPSWPAFAGPEWVTCLN